MNDNTKAPKLHDIPLDSLDKELIIQLIFNNISVLSALSVQYDHKVPFIARNQNPFEFKQALLFTYRHTTIKILLDDIANKNLRSCLKSECKTGFENAKHLNDNDYMEKLMQRFYKYQYLRCFDRDYYDQYIVPVRNNHNDIGIKAVLDAYPEISGRQYELDNPNKSFVRIKHNIRKDKKIEIVTKAKIYNLITQL